MITSYIIILILSAGLVAFAALRVTQHMMRMFSLSGALPAGATALLCALMFLVVVSAPASMLVGVIMVALAHLLQRRYAWPPLAVEGVALLAAFMAIDASMLPIVASTPPLVMHGALVGLLVAITYTGRWLPAAFNGSSLGLGACLLPLLAAPIFSTAANSIALDAALIAAALLGAWLGAARHGSVMGFTHAPFALLLGWLMLQPAMHGAWLFSLISLLVYGGFIAYALTQQPFDDRYGA